MLISQSPDQAVEVGQQVNIAATWADEDADRGDVFFRVFTPGEPGRYIVNLTRDEEDGVAFTVEAPQEDTARIVIDVYPR